MDPAAREAERIRAEYGRRDSTAPSRESAWLDPVHRLGLQELESGMLDELGRTGIRLAGARALEVGCGSGYFLSRLLDYGVSEGVGIDLVEERIAAARERYPQLELVVGDAAQLPWADGSFQLVTQFTCLSSVLDSDVRRGVAAEMWRVLAPGGALVSYDMRPPPPAVRAFRRLVSRGAAPPPAASAPLDVAELRKWLPDAQLRERAVGVDPELARLLHRLRLPLRPAARGALSVHALAVARKPG
jgi:ubiquinone/menaquinone biosynthesis C-methylase UbiE